MTGLWHCRGHFLEAGGVGPTSAGRGGPRPLCAGLGGSSLEKQGCFSELISVSGSRSAEQAHGRGSLKPKDCRIPTLGTQGAGGSLVYPEKG